MNTSEFIAARNFARAGKYPEALQEIAKIDGTDRCTVEALILKSRILQLIDDEGSLDEVEKVLQLAVQEYPKSAQAFIEKGWFDLNVKNDPGEAQESFEAALRLQKEINTEMLAGIVLCDDPQREIIKLDEAISSLIQLLADRNRLAKVLKERSWPVT